MLVEDVHAEELSIADANARWLPAGRMSSRSPTTKARRSGSTLTIPSGAKPVRTIWQSRSWTRLPQSDVDHAIAADATREYEEERLESKLDVLEDGSDDLDDAIEQELAVDAALESIHALDLEPVAPDASEELVEKVVAEELDSVDANARWLPTWTDELPVADDEIEARSSSRRTIPSETKLARPI